MVVSIHFVSVDSAGVRGRIEIAGGAGKSEEGRFELEQIIQPVAYHKKCIK